MVVLFKSNKSLAVTARSVIMQGENMADKLLFYLPTSYEDVIFADPDVKLFYRDPGNNVHMETLKASASDKDGYLLYTLDVTSALTDLAGVVTLWLEIVNTSTDSGISDDVIVSTIRSFETELTIHEWDSYSLASSVSELEAKIDALTKKVDELIEKVDPVVSA